MHQWILTDSTLKDKTYWIVRNSRMQEEELKRKYFPSITDMKITPNNEEKFSNIMLKNFPKCWEISQKALIFCLDIMNLNLHRAIHFLFSYDKFVMESGACAIRSPASYFGGPGFNSLVQRPAIPTEDLYFPYFLLGCYLQFRHSRFLPRSFQLVIHQTSIIRCFAIWKLKELLHK